MKLGVHKCSKVTEPDFSGKFSISEKWGKMTQKGYKIGILDFGTKLSHYFLLEMSLNEASYGWLTLCANPISGKILILEIYVRKLSTKSDPSIFQITISSEPFNSFL